ncbi:MAG: DNA-directed RNA polymerase subunit omega [Eubacteriales bacterium]|nr:DNA-directed RNA polymerase subunit omega [Eubacteriales bacterium]MDD4324482.1 DNA-directed RNA polymerase subunit omega [Eubacteriales bacterium]MDD4541388.1 DNA-directed RNA polymerase subunit omega [Eubacteriales bacterium]
MLTKPPLEQLLPRAENRYVLAMFAARRARQLTEGARPLVESKTPSQVSLACEEIGAGAVVYRQGKHEFSIPERPEIIAQREASRREAEAKRAEDLLEEQRRPSARRQAREGSTFEKEGISAQEASLIAEQLVQFVTEQESQEEGQVSAEIDFTSFSRSLNAQDQADADENEEDEE